MRTAFFACFIAAISTQFAVAEKINGQRHYCVGEAAGGLAYVDATKTYRGAAFKPDAKFILGTKWVKSGRSQYQFIPEPVDFYSISITETGSNKTEICTSLGKEPEFVEVHGLDTFVSCSALLHQYRFNFRLNRFMKAFLYGYVNGTNSTPVIELGQCTKLE